MGFPCQYAVYRSAAVMGTSRRHRFCGSAVAVGGRRDTLCFSGQRNVEEKQAETLNSIFPTGDRIVFIDELY